MPRKILRSLRIDEISAVDRPAQAGAKFTLMKRADPSPDTPSPQEETPMTDTTTTKMDSKPDGLSAGEWKAVQNMRSNQKDGDMKKSDEDAAALAKANQIIALKADERAHYDTLSGADADAFLAKSDADRATVVAKANEPDAVVYVCKADGREYRKSDGEAAIAMAKRFDEQAETIAKMQGEAEHNTLMKRADDELPTHGGTTGERAMVIKAIDAIPDEAARKRAHEIVKAGPVPADAMQSFGATGSITKSGETAADDSWGPVLKSGGFTKEGK